MGVPSVTYYQIDLKKSHERLQGRIPSAKDALLMGLVIDEAMQDMRKVHDPADYFVNPDIEYAHQKQKWSETKDLVGIGPLAYWRLNGYAGYNLPYTQYVEEVGRGNRPIYFFKKLCEDELLAQMAVFSIKTRQGVSLHKFRERYPTTYTMLQLLPKQLTKMEKLGLINNDGYTITPTNLGMHLADEVALCFRLKPEIEFYKNKRISPYDNTF